MGGGGQDCMMIDPYFIRIEVSYPDGEHQDEEIRPDDDVSNDWKDISEFYDDQIKDPKIGGDPPCRPHETGYFCSEIETDKPFNINYLSVTDGEIPYGMHTIEYSDGGEDMTRNPDLRHRRIRVKGNDPTILVTENPYTGTAQQVITLSIGIYEASVELDARSMRALRNQLPITDKIYSKLRVIGKTCSDLPPSQLKVVMKAMPDSYSTIHALCGLKAQELHTAAKSRRVNRTTTTRTARDYVRQVRFPALTGNPEARPATLTTSRTKADPTWKTLLTIHEDPERPQTKGNGTPSMTESTRSHKNE